MVKKRIMLPVERVEETILLIRDQRVILDADLAKLYGVTTKRLNEQVKRNLDRFPKDFMFQLKVEEKADVVANCDHLSTLEVISKKEKWFEVKPPARGAYAPEGTVYGLKNPGHRSGLLLSYPSG